MSTAVIAGTFPEHEAHPAAAIFPMMGEADLAALAEDIRINGLHDDIVLCDEKLVDGRNRYAACRLAGVTPRFKQWDRQGSVVSWVLSSNLHRRHLTDQQRALIAAKAKAAFEVEAEERRIANLLQNKASTESADLRSREPVTPENGKSAAKAAKELRVSTRAVEQAATILRRGDDSLVEAVNSGAVSLDAGATVSKLPRSEQKKLVLGGNVRSAAAKLRSMRAQEKTPIAQPEPAPDRILSPTPRASRVEPFAVVFDALPKPRRQVVRDLVRGVMDLVRQLGAAKHEDGDLALDGLLAFVERTREFLRGNGDGDFLQEAVEGSPPTADQVLSQVYSQL